MSFYLEKYGIQIMQRAMDAIFFHDCTIRAHHNPDVRFDLIRKGIITAGTRTVSVSATWRWTNHTYIINENGHVVGNYIGNGFKQRYYTYRVRNGRSQTIVEINIPENLIPNFLEEMEKCKSSNGTVQV